MRHTKCECGECHACRHDLFTCIVCGASEGELTLCCPGVTVPPSLRIEVLTNNVQFIDGSWFKRAENGGFRVRLTGMPDRCFTCGAKHETHDKDHVCRMHRGKFDRFCSVCGSDE